MRVGVRFGVLVILLSGLGFTPVLAEDMRGVVLYETKAKFDEARQDLEDSIVNRGYVIDYNAKIGAMLERTETSA